ncbi:MAG: DUF2382 domain-containing protein [Microcoleus vaginatus WJT46-NPBG5]|jgi:uncharacterized protein (TIGR02271 family)|nr:DUF2382 domain-containing protein [Microcoleus vaginatus WJT46-NPBG5]
MALVKLEDFYPNYRDEIFGGDDIKGLDVYAGTSEEKIGTIHDALVDESGRFRYLVLDTGFWVFGKKVLLPIGSCRIDYDARRVYATNLLNKEQAERLPAYDELQPIDYDHEEQVRDVYRAPATTADATAVQPTANTADRDTYTYDREPALYNMNERDHATLRLYEERLIANKTRQKTGEVTVGKRVETETARASVPIERERVVIERTTPTSSTPVAPGDANFQAGQVAHMEVYEETPDIRKEAFVREEVGVRKEIERETVDAEETLRREELDVQAEGRTIVNKGPEDSANRRI